MFAFIFTLAGLGAAGPDAGRHLAREPGVEVAVAFLERLQPRGSVIGLRTAGGGEEEQGEDKEAVSSDRSGGQSPEPAVMVIFDCLGDFGLAVHDEWTEGGHGFVDGRSVEHQERGVLPSFDAQLLALPGQQRQVGLSGPFGVCQGHVAVQDKEGSRKPGGEY
jgi:hypothetical protein